MMFGTSHSRSFAFIKCLCVSSAISRWMCSWKVIFDAVQHCYLSSTTSQCPDMTGPPSQRTQLDQKFIRETK